MGEIKLNRYNDHEEGHYRSIQGNMSEKITMAKESLVEIKKGFVKNEKEKIGMLLTNLISIWYGQGQRQRKKKG